MFNDDFECEEEASEEEASPTDLQDDLAQFTPPKRRKLAARRRRHPAGDVSISGTGSAAGSTLNDGTVAASTASISNCNHIHYRSRRHCINRPRRRRRHASHSSGPGFHQRISAVTSLPENRRVEAPVASFVLPPANFPWYGSDKSMRIG